MGGLEAEHLERVVNLTGLKVGGAIVDCGVPGSVAPLDVPVLVLADVEDKWWNGCVVGCWPALYDEPRGLDCQAGS